MMLGSCLVERLATCSLGATFQEPVATVHGSRLVASGTLETRGDVAFALKAMLVVPIYLE